MLGHIENLPGALRRASYVVMTAFVALALVIVMGFAATCAATIANNPGANDISYGMCVGNNGLPELGTPSALYGSNFIRC
ncbi:MAG: hypothetical protein WBW04_00465 [Nitrolancea sp.]